MSARKLPFGIDDVRGPVVEVGANNVRCCHVGCRRIVRRKRSGDTWTLDWFCPEHGIMTHGRTYSYKEKDGNIFIERNLFRAVKKQHDQQLRNENSEDALSWNLFVGFHAAGLLKAAFAVLTGETPKAEPQLFLWGNRISREGVTLWPALLDARSVIEDRRGTPTEPDIALHVPGSGLVLVEAKLGSPNSTLKGKRERWPTVEGWLRAYRPSSEVADPLDRSRIRRLRHEGLLEQLCRMAVFGAQMRLGTEKVWVVNLLRRRAVAPSEPLCDDHFKVDGPVRFRVSRWEDLFPVAEKARGLPLAKYMLEKSCNLKRAFDLPVTV